MATKKEPTQDTPGGATIPVPKRKDVLGDLRKIAKADKPSDDGGVSGTEQEK